MRILYHRFVIFKRLNIHIFVIIKRFSWLIFVIFKEFSDRSAPVKKSRHEKRFLLFYFFKSGHWAHFLAFYFFKSRHAAHFSIVFFFKSRHTSISWLDYDVSEQTLAPLLKLCFQMYFS